MFQVKFWKNRFIQINIFIVCTYFLCNSVIFSICFASQGEITDKTKKPETAILIRAATPKEEFDIILYTLRSMAFFREHGYDIALPDHERFTQLSESSVNISKTDKKELYELFAWKIYGKSKYEKGLKGLGHAEKIIKNAFPIFEKFKENWDFTVHKSYEVILTLYGQRTCSRFESTLS